MSMKIPSKAESITLFWIGIFFMILLLITFVLIIWMLIRKNTNRACQTTEAKVITSPMTLKQFDIQPIDITI